MFLSKVAYIATFKFVMAKLGIGSSLADYSVSSSPVQHLLLDPEKKFIGIYTNDAYYAFCDWLVTKTEMRGVDYDLQIDIEGANYENLNSNDEKFLKKFE